MVAGILLVEDDNEVREVLCEAAKATGHESTCVGTFREGLEEIRSGRYQLLLSNVRLPDGNGYDLAEQAVQAGIKAVLISGHPDEFGVLEMRALAHLRKPFDIDEMTAMVAAHVGVALRD